MGNQCEGFSSSAVNKQPQHTEGKKKKISQTTRQHIDKKHTEEK